MLENPVPGLYRTREGGQAKVLEVGVSTSNTLSNTPEIIGYVQFSTGKVKLASWYMSGAYRGDSDPHDFDLIEPWVDPVFKYYPLFIKGPSQKPFEDMDSAIEHAGSATEDNPLMGYLRVDIVANRAVFAKPGEEFK